MKKFASILLAALFLTACSGSGDRNEILKVYNWSCYIDEDLIEEFEDWYEEQTGEKVEVIYQTFDINETMLAKIEMGHEDYDVVCPSEYIIERMLMSDLLQPIPRDFGNTPDYISNISPFIIERFSQIDGNGKNANEYSVGYMWGTAGLIYNPKYVNRDETNSWDVLKNPKYAGKIMIKDAFRDVYTSLLIAMNKEAIDKGEVDIAKLTFDSSDESVKKVEDFLTAIRDNVAGWEADFGKEELCKERVWLSFNWSGDAQWAIEEAEKIGVELEYSVPEEGSIVWFDGWVIPKYAKNVKAASYFINYMCMPENAIRNMDEIGYVSAVGGEEVLNSITDSCAFEPIDATYFFGTDATNVCINKVQYPDTRTINSCGMMHDNRDRTEILLAMWSRVKGESATNWTIILISATAVILIVFFAIPKKLNRKNRRK